jgi:arginase
MLKLLIPEWQGCGTTHIVADGARRLAQAWWGHEPWVTVEAPDDEVLEVRQGVCGLDSMAERLRAVRAVLEREAPTRVMTVGGTCGVEVGPVSWLNERYGGDLAVVWLDAHADLNTPASSPSGHFHGMVLRTLLGEGPDALVAHVARPLQPGQVVLAGVRDLDPPEAAFVGSSGISVFKPESFVEPDALALELRARGFTRAYVHLDVDVINPDDFGSSLMRTPGGPTLPEVIDVVASLHRHLDVVGFSVVEYAEHNKNAAQDRDRLVTALRGAHVRLCCGR